MNIDDPVCSLCLEEDGTAVEDDEVLTEFRDKVFLILTSAELWTPPSSSALSTVEAAPVNLPASAPASPATDGHVVETPFSSPGTGSL